MMGQDPDTGSLESLYGALGEARIGGGGYPARIWAQYTRTALADSDPVEFDLELMPGANQPPVPPPVNTDPTPSQEETPGDRPTGRPGRPTRTPSTGGQTNGGQTTGGQNTGGQTNGGQTNGGQTTGGQTTGGQTTGGQTTGGQTTGGETTGGETDGGATTGTQGGATEGLRPPADLLE